mgnify:CR=1 FL=1
MVDKILLDTNILLDYLLMREPFYDNASEIVRRCVDGIYRGCVAAHSISNMFFILRKTYNIKERREILLSICEIFISTTMNTTKISIFALSATGLDLKMKIFLILKIVFKWNVPGIMGRNIL